MQSKELRESIEGCLTNPADIDWIMPLLAKRCWLKDEREESVFDVTTISSAEYDVYVRLMKAGWRPIKEIK